MQEIHNEYLEKANQYVEKEGLTSLLGMRLTYLQPGEAVGEIDLEEKHMNFHRGAHGGTLFALADTVCGFSIFSLGRSCTTVNGSIEYMRAVTNCKKIICSAKTVKYGKTLAWVECEIKNELDTLLCTAKFVYYLLEEIEI